MATPPRIRVMISSRCSDPIEFGGVQSKLSAVRLRLKEELELRHPDLDYQAWFIDRDAAGRFNQWKVLVAGPEIA